VESKNPFVFIVSRTFNTMTLDIKETINNFYNEVGLNPKDYPNPVSA
jgi:hypothetical protein